MYSIELPALYYGRELLLAFLKKSIIILKLDLEEF